MIIGVAGKINSGKDTVGQIIKIILDNPHLNNEGILNFIEKKIYNNKKSPYYPSWEIRKFADKLKDMVCLLIGCTREQLEDREFKEKELGEEWWYYKDKLNDSITNYNDFTDKNYEIMYHLIKLTPRTLLQLLGTECGRRIIHPNVWVNALMSEYKPINRKGDAIPMQYGGLYKIPEDSKYPEKHWNKTVISKEFEWEELPNWIITDMRFPNELKAVKNKEGITIRVNRPHKSLIESVKKQVYEVEHESEKALDNAEFDHVINNNGTLEDLIDKVREILIKEKLIK